MPSHRTHSKRDRDRSRSPHWSHRNKTDKDKGKEKDVLVRKRVKHGDASPPNPPSWLLWVAGAAISREDRRKHKYSLEEHGKGKDRENRDRRRYLNEEYDNDDGYPTLQDQTARLNAKMEELSRLPRHVLDAMEREEELRHQQKASIRPQMPGEAPRQDFDNLDNESVYEGYMRRKREQELRHSKRENP